MLQKTVLKTLLLVSVSYNVYAQNGPGEDWEIQIRRGEFSKRQVVPPAPEAAELGKYGNIPVSLYTGTPQISIPFYEIKGNSLSLPITFSYHAGGFKPEDVATWVGLGWALNAGGVVTRSIMGAPDTYDNYFSPSQQTTVNYSDQFAVEQYKQDLKLGVKERQTDFFFYNFAGYSGKFMIRQNREVYTKEKNNLKFSHCIDLCTPSSFIQITDNSGTVYEFREVETANLEIRDFEGGSGNTNYTYPSSWYLTKITSADGQEEITLSYSSTAAFHKQYTNSFANRIANYEWVANGSGGGYFVLSNIGSGLPPVTKTYRKYLSNISFKRGGSLVLTADFTSVTDQRDDLQDADFPGEQMLKSITISGKDESMQFKEIKKINLSQSYFVNSTNTQNKRLRLDAITEVASSSPISTQPKPPYSFEYNDGSTIPAYETPSLDHWGFFNGGADLLFQREPSYAHASQTVMNKIKYPTGGYTMFEYEPHQAKNTTGGTMTVGGVRIKKVTDYSFENQKATVKNYEYLLADNTTSGNAVVPDYESQYSFTNYIYDDPFTVEGGSTTKLSKSATAVHGLGSYQGSHIGYTRVTEYLSDLNNNKPLGKTVYEYYHDGSGGDDDKMISGTLYKQTVFDNTGKMLQETENTVFSNDIMPFMSGTGVGALQGSNNLILCKKTDGAFAWKLVEAPAPSCVQILTFPQAKLTTNSYTFSKQWVQLTEQTQKTYDQLSNSYITNKKKFTYGNTAHTLPTMVEQTTTDSKQVITTKKYAADYTLPNLMLSGQAQGIKNLMDKNIIGAEVESYQYRQDPGGANKKYLGGSITVFDPVLPYPVSAQVVETKTPLNSFTASDVNTSGVFTQDVNYKPAGALKYTNGQLTEQRKQDDIPASYIWGYNNMFPIAEISNADNNSVAYTSFEGSPEGGTAPGFGNWVFSVTGNIHGFLQGTTATPGITGNRYFTLTTNTMSKPNLTIGNKYVVSYWSQNGAYTVGGATAVSYRSGKTIRGWTYHQHLVTATATTITINGTGVIDEVRLYPEKALMQTYTYNPFIGMSSSCSANNNITYYEYDGYNRLIFARDEDRNIVKNYQYNYNPSQTAIAAGPQTLFYSRELNVNFTRNNCPPDAVGGTVVTYTVPYGKYVSAISDTDAVSKAWNDVNTNGQAYANTNGQCRWVNDQRQSATAYVKNDCGPEHGPGLPLAGFIYTVPAGAHTSYISKADANAKADADIIQNAQNNANLLGTCACPYPARKRINGVGPCIRGIKVYTSSVYLGNGNWLCTFYYQFPDNSTVGDFTETTTTPCMF